VTREPRRTCVACRQVRDKRELVRLVRRAEGTVVVDERGRAAGRGAYVCRGAGCVARLLKGGRLSQAFRRPSRAEGALVTAVEAASDVVSGENLVTSSGR
jgi:uncharacterized protein